MKHVFTIVLILILFSVRSFAQTYMPVGISGFNNDVVAESGASATAVTTTDLDLSFYLLYSASFAAANGISGGMADNGTITSGTRTYQLAPYDSSNALYLSASAVVANTDSTGTLALDTPAAFNKISLLLFSTEGDSRLAITLHFTDGTTATGASVNIQDWFDGANAVYSSFGRIARQAAPPYTVDGLSGGNPRFYSLDIPMACSNQPKLLDSITIRYISGTSTLTSSRAVILALSGVPYTPVDLSADITPATCNRADGSIALSATGGMPPLSFTWATAPVQLGDTARNLPAGDYMCTILDANGCATTYTGTVPGKTAATLAAQASPDAICAGDSVKLTADASGPVSNVSWQPGGGSGEELRVAPAATTAYTVRATDSLGCELSTTVQVTVTDIPPSPVVDGATACPDSTVTLLVQNAGAAYTYHWYTGAQGSAPVGVGVTYTVPADRTDAIYFAEAINGMCTSPRTVVTIDWLERVAAPVVTATEITPGSVTFVWQPVPGATGYQVSVNGGAYTAPSSGPAGTRHQVTGLPLSEGVTISVMALGAVACQHSEPATAMARLLSQDIFIPNAFTPNNDGLNDIFRAEGNIITGQQLRIFNQWGEQIFSTSEAGAGWDGTHNGKAQPAGVYVYAIRLKLADGKEVLRKGAVNLIR
ncbi:T9SS type B sorting domain-containing protein [Chitinophaga japonensis]|uniref:Gliding motility-associated-like protein n=1 Tax=Chitinophaga japonensis TaxID=104662 RepID=A0A562SMQ1_CHIJA|nr:gliding motility-associated C-terminal domain-containing protein [Chitinophaga japonensis]TWI82498.1 gliding motility-associated-like protein [Chitinophaga japonensis]